MFLHLPEQIARRMEYLEKMDQTHRKDGLDKWHRLRQVPRATGKFLALIAAAAPAGEYLEIGTSGGYSGLWIALACRMRGQKLVTFELLKEKVKIAQETFQKAGVSDLVEIIHGDARDLLDPYKQVSFCFLDAEKDVYLDCYEKIVPNMVAGGMLAADNVISHKAVLDQMIGRVLADERVDALVIPIGNGVLLCRKI
jgi:caffeoyl-CoA O-methyltransferase